VPWPLRSALRVDEQLARDYFRDSRHARTFPAAAVQEGRPNGEIGLEGEVDSSWRLSIGDASLTLEDLRALPKSEMRTELKCIEGWSRVLHWGGVRFRDFLQKYAPSGVNPNGYVGLETPDGEYYVGLDAPSAMHPQTLLAFEMNGGPLTPEHGAPLRLVVPVKYGIKNLKRVGRVFVSSTRPPDYWAERAYDWYAGF
jgi:DMSO/TMAO reductase YedYZ molybdopterin-dependent catalytic subunit